MEKTGKIYGINGPVIYIKGKTDFKMGEMVYVSSERLAYWPAWPSIWKRKYKNIEKNQGKALNCIEKLCKIN